MWTCTACQTEVDDQYKYCPQCGTGRNGSKPPVNHVSKKDALQPELPTTNTPSPKEKSRLLSISLVVVVIIILLIIAFSG